MDDKRKSEILLTDYSLPKITEETKQQMQKDAQKGLCREVKIQLGQVYKTGEFEKHSDEVLGRELP